MKIIKDEKVLERKNNKLVVTLSGITEYGPLEVLNIFEQQNNAKAVMYGQLFQSYEQINNALRNIESINKAIEEKKTAIEELLPHKDHFIRKAPKSWMSGDIKMSTKDYNKNLKRTVNLVNMNNIQIAKLKTKIKERVDKLL